MADPVASTAISDEAFTPIESPITVDEAEQAYLKRATATRAKAAEQSASRTKSPPRNTDRQAAVDDEDDNQPVPDAEPTDDADEDATTKDSGEDDAAEETFAGDEAKVRVKVGDQEHVVDVKTLKRLFGQESALTKKSQDVAQKTKDYEAKTIKAVTAIQTLAERAKAQYEPYSQIDWAAAARKLPEAEYKQLEADARDAHSNLKYLVEELDSHMTTAKTHFTEQTKEAAKACVAQLKDEASPHFIESWSQETYTGMRDFSIKAGLTSDMFDQLTDPAALKIIHDAMQYRKGNARAKEVITAAKSKVVSAKQVKSQKASSASELRDGAAMSRLRESGSLDDAAAVYLARAQARRRSQA